MLKFRSYSPTGNSWQSRHLFPQSHVISFKHRLWLFDYDEMLMESVTVWINAFSYENRCTWLENHLSQFFFIWFFPFASTIHTYAKRFANHIFLKVSLSFKDSFKNTSYRNNTLKAIKTLTKILRTNTGEFRTRTSRMQGHVHVHYTTVSDIP